MDYNQMPFCVDMQPRRNNWNNLLLSLTEKYGNGKFEAPQIIGDYRDQLAKPPPMVESDGDVGYSVSEICSPRVIAKLNELEQSKNNTFRQKRQWKKTRVLKSTMIPVQHSAKGKENKAEGIGEQSCVEVEERPDVEFICTLEIPKPPKYYIHPVSGKKRLNKFIEM